MLELGPQAAALHREAGREIAKCGINMLWGVRGLAREIILGAEEQGLTVSRFFDSAAEAAIALIAEVRTGDLILVKGSRGVATDKVVNALREHFPLTEQEKA
jgi:UDP-N-acetylmuramoyl-tripeptide--D-alanyl-D-alanine ligase